MLLMCHLFIGFIIGLLAFRLLKDRRVVILAAIGSLLPDLIDKPLGHIILNGSIDFGRIYAHSGLFLLAIVVVAIVYHQKKGSWLLMRLAAGVLSHLALDAIWEIPVTLYYPLLGGWGHYSYPNYIGDSIARELESVYEWMFGLSALGMLLFTYREKLGMTAANSPGSFPGIEDLGAAAGLGRGRVDSLRWNERVQPVLRQDRYGTEPDHRADRIGRRGHLLLSLDLQKVRNARRRRQMKYNIKKGLSKRVWKRL